MRKRVRGASGINNQNRRVRGWDSDPLAEAAFRTGLVKRVGYAGSPQHKRNPGDFGLTPPASPRQDASLYDYANITQRATALALLRKGVEQGLVSEQMRNDYPNQIWSIRNDKVVFEARLENEVQGNYHGYPLPLDDPFRLILLQRLELLTDV